MGRELGWTQKCLELDPEVSAMSTGAPAQAVMHRC